MTAIPSLVYADDHDDPVVRQWRIFADEAQAKGDQVMADFYSNAIAGWHGDDPSDFRAEEGDAEHERRRERVQP